MLCSDLFHVVLLKLRDWILNSSHGLFSWKKDWNIYWDKLSMLYLAMIVQGFKQRKIISHKKEESGRYITFL